jgi:putative transposase
VSTRKVAPSTAERGGRRVSRSTVRPRCTALAARGEAWKARALAGPASPCVVIDARVGKGRRDSAGRATRARIVAGVKAQGRRESLGLSLGASASAGTWPERFVWRTRRGWQGGEVLVSDAQAGWVQAAQRAFPGGSWPRGHVPLQRQGLGRPPRPLRAQRAAGRRRICQAEDLVAARPTLAAVAAARAGQADRALLLLAAGREEALAVLGLPAPDRLRWRTTNGMERRNEARRRRARVRRSFPTEASALRLMGALLAEQPEVWSTGKRSCDMTEYFAWKIPPTQEVPQEIRTVSCTEVERPGKRIYSTFWT